MIRVQLYGFETWDVTLSRRTSKLSNFSLKGTQWRDGGAVVDTHIVDSSLCIEYIINLVQHRVKIIRGLKIEVA
jgi:hypothetical protein